MKTKIKNIGIIVIGVMFASSAALASSFGVSGSETQNTSSSEMTSQGQTNNKQQVGSSVNGADQSTALGDTETSQEAFAKTLNNLMPLTPGQTKILRKSYDDIQKAASESPGVAPKPTSSSVIVNLSPGSTPPVIRLRAGYISSLVFLDSTGEPWPITAYDIGNPSSFNIQPTTPDGKTNSMLVQASSTYQSGNLAVMLKGQNTPIMLTLMPGQQAVDYRVDLRVPGFGPNAKPTTDGMPQSSDPMLLTFLDGVAPHGARAVKIEGGGDSQAWVYAHHLYVRTRLTLLSPSWISTMSSPDGTHVYQLTEAPVILVSDHGKLMQLKIEGL